MLYCVLYIIQLAVLLSLIFCGLLLGIGIFHVINEDSDADLIEDLNYIFQKLFK